MAHLWVQHHLQQRIEHHVVGHQLAAVDDGLQEDRTVNWCIEFFSCTSLDTDDNNSNPMANGEQQQHVLACHSNDMEAPPILHPP